jgi:hypothetical protein
MPGFVKGVRCPNQRGFRPGLKPPAVSFYLEGSIETANLRRCKLCRFTLRRIPWGRLDQSIPLGGVMANQCMCAVGNHGHEPGECQAAATEANNLCKDCHAKAQEALETQKSFPDESF